MSLEVGALRLSKVVRAFLTAFVTLILQWLILMIFQEIKIEFHIILLFVSSSIFLIVLFSIWHVILLTLSWRSKLKFVNDGQKLFTILIRIINLDRKLPKLFRLLNLRSTFCSSCILNWWWQFSLICKAKPPLFLRFTCIFIERIDFFLSIYYFVQQYLIFLVFINIHILILGLMFIVKEDDLSILVGAAATLIVKHWVG